MNEAAASESPAGPVIGLDFGGRRIGLAVSDEAGGLAFPAGILDRRDLARDLEALSQLARERGAIRFVMGLPLHMDGRPGPEAAAARKFAAALEQATSLPVEWIDERWTTLEARRIQQEMAATRSRRAEPVDDAAAAIILRTWLERERNRKPGESR